MAITRNQGATQGATHHTLMHSPPRTRVRRRQPVTPSPTNDPVPSIKQELSDVNGPGIALQAFNTPNEGGRTYLGIRSPALGVTPTRDEGHRIEEKMNMENEIVFVRQRSRADRFGLSGARAAAPSPSSSGSSLRKRKRADSDSGESEVSHKRAHTIELTVAGSEFEHLSNQATADDNRPDSRADMQSTINSRLREATNIQHVKMKMREMQYELFDAHSAKATLAHILHLALEKIRSIDPDWKPSVNIDDALSPERASGSSSRAAEGPKRTRIDLPAVIVQGDRLDLGDELVIKVGRPLGEGGHGKVFAADVITCGEIDVPELLAVKSMRKSERNREAMDREIKGLSVLGDAGLAPKLVTAVETPVCFLIVMERHGVSLWDLLHRLVDRNGRVQHSKIREIAYELTLILDELNKLKYSHRDLKPENILVNEEGRFILADMGTVGSSSALFGWPCGTDGFRAPEAGTARKKQGRCLDIWSLGAILFWLAGNHTQVENATFDDVMIGSDTQTGQLIDRLFAEDDHPNASDFVKKCLKINPKARMTVKEALEHPWFDMMPSSPSTRWPHEGARIIDHGNRDHRLWHVNLGFGECYKLDFE